MTLQHFDHYLRFSFLALMSALLVAIMFSHVMGIEKLSAQPHDGPKSETIGSALS